MSSKKAFAAALAPEVADLLRRKPDPETLASWLADRVGDQPDATQDADVRAVVKAYEEGHNR